MTLRPYKFQIVAVVQQVEDDVVVGEQASEPIVVFGCENLAEWAQKFSEQLAAVKEPVG